MLLRVPWLLRVVLLATEEKPLWLHLDWEIQRKHLSLLLRNLKELTAVVRMCFGSHKGDVNFSFNSLDHRRKERGNTGRCPAKSHMSK